MQGASQLETVVKAEIKARIDAVKQLTEQNAAEHTTLRGQMARCEQKVELILEAQRALNGKHDALHAAHTALQAESRAAVAEAREAAAHDVATTRDVLEGKVTALSDTLVTRTKEVEAACQVRPISHGHTVDREGQRPALALCT